MEARLENQNGELQLANTQVQEKETQLSHKQMQLEALEVRLKEAHHERDHTSQREAAAKQREAAAAQSREDDLSIQLEQVCENGPELAVTAHVCRRSSVRQAVKKLPAKLWLIVLATWSNSQS